MDAKDPGHTAGVLRLADPSRTPWPSIATSWRAVHKAHAARLAFAPRSGIWIHRPEPAMRTRTLADMHQRAAEASDRPRPPAAHLARLAGRAHDEEPQQQRGQQRQVFTVDRRVAEGFRDHLGVKTGDARSGTYTLYGGITVHIPKDTDARGTITFGRLTRADAPRERGIPPAIQIVRALTFQDYEISPEVRDRLIDHFGLRSKPTSSTPASAESIYPLRFGMTIHDRSAGGGDIELEFTGRSGGPGPWQEPYRVKEIPRPRQRQPDPFRGPPPQRVEPREKRKG
jgi:hypothetical protein